ncbi:integrase core domain-containing protein [Jannaschia marina]|uniref:integrase core domain-containing protein n=1 Tax=Jannaschia marina TaxID=2741674 RepID=UPI0015CA4614
MGGGTACGRGLPQGRDPLPGRASRSDVPKGEAFNSKLRAECPTAHWFMSLADSHEQLEIRRGDHNEVRPHSAIGDNVPADIHTPDGSPSPPS